MTTQRSFVTDFEVVVWDRLAERDDATFTVQAATWEDAVKAARSHICRIGYDVNENCYEGQFVIKSIVCGTPNDLVL
jgi:hypothetical protein